MRRSDDVFFFTLIDFLVQVFFFGLLLYVVAQATEEQSKKTREQEAAEVKKLVDAAGLSNITELTDELTKLAPLKELRGFSDFLIPNGGFTEVKKASEVVSQAGGAKSIEEKLARLRKFEEGSGKPPCFFDIVKERKVSKPLATVIATDSTIRFERSTVELEEALKLIGRRFESVQELPFSEFRKAFAPLVEKRSDCRYKLRFIEETRLVYGRDAAGSTFYLDILKR